MICRLCSKHWWSQLSINFFVEFSHGSTFFSSSYALRIQNNWVAKSAIFWWFSFIKNYATHRKITRVTFCLESAEEYEMYFYFTKKNISLVVNGFLFIANFSRAIVDICNRGVKKISMERWLLRAIKTLWAPTLIMKEFCKQEGIEENNKFYTMDLRSLKGLFWTRNWKI